MRTRAIPRLAWAFLCGLAFCAHGADGTSVPKGSVCTDILSSSFEDSEADPSVFPGPEGLCAQAHAWGPPGTPLPTGATMVPIEEFLALAGIEGGFDIITRAGLDAGILAGDSRDSAARALVDGLAAADATLARLKPVDPAPQIGTERLGDGNYRITLPNGDDETGQFIVQGLEWRYGEVAGSLTRTLARDNREASYRALYAALPADRRAGLPDPEQTEAFDALGDATLDAHARELVRRVETFVPNETVPSEVATIAEAKVGLPGSNCENHSLGNLFANYDWPLKATTTRVRNQGNRGSCMAHAAVAGLESVIKRNLGFETNYSEQELFSAAKGLWFPTADAYGDGLNGGNVLDEMLDRAYRVDAEPRWRYNPSWLRVDDKDANTYTQSCVNYVSSYCSDTNHQMKVACTLAGNQLVCAATRPPGVTGAGHDPAVLTQYVSLWNPLEPENSLAAIRAHLNAGHPVYYSFDVDDWFSAASDIGLREDPVLGSLAPANSGVVSQSDGGAGEVGGHGMLIVGYVSNAIVDTKIPFDHWPDGPGGGYLIAKNSWGCAGDGGYMYINYSWAMDQAHSAFAILDVSTTAARPSAAITTDSSLVSDAGSMPIRVAVNQHTTRVRVYRGLEDVEPRFVGNRDGGEPGTMTFTETFTGSEDNGVQLYFARASDQFGNVVTSGITGVQVQIDDETPEVTLAASPGTAISAPGNLVLQASASDNVGVTRVRFYRGFQFLGEVTAAPFRLTRAIAVSDVGVDPYLAIAYDGAGNTKMSNVVDVTVTAPLRPIVQQFSAQPGALTGPGDVTLSWSTLGAQSVSISPGVGAVAGSGSVVVPVTQSTTFVLAATNSAGTAGATASVSVVPAPVIVRFTATPSSLPAGGGTVDLGWTVLGANSLSIDAGVGNVTGLSHREVSVAQTTSFTLTATSAGGSSTRSIIATVASGDTQPPTVALSASDTFVKETATITLTATASDNVGVARVEFLRGGALLGTDSSSPFEWPVPLTAADNGTIVFTARAIDGADNAATSAPVNVVVEIEGPPGGVDTYVSPTGTDAGNDCAAVATPCATIPYAGARTGEGKTMFLLDGTYATTSQGTGDDYRVPDGVSIAGMNAPLPNPRAVVQLRLRVSNASVRAIMFDRTAGDPAGVEVVGGEVELIDIALRGPFVAPDLPGIEVTGNAEATLSTSDAPGFANLTEAHTQPSVALIHVRDNAQFTMSGIALSGPGVGTSLLAGDPGPGAIELIESASLRIDDSDIRVRSRAITQQGTTTLEIAGTTIDASEVTDHAYGILIAGANTAATLVVEDSTIEGFRATAPGTTGAAIAVTAGTPPPNGSISGIELIGTALSDSTYGLLVASTGAVEISAVDSSISTNRHGGVRAEGWVRLSLEGGEVAGNAFDPPGAAPTPRYGGIWLGSDKHCEVELRGVSVRDNNNGAVAPDNHGMTLRCDASSTFDLGTNEFNPGNNTFSQGDVPTSTSNLFVDVAPSVLVNAVGNTFNADEQGADDNGRYRIGEVPCPAGFFCDVTSGTGVNYRVDSGTLRLDAVIDP